MHKIAQVNNIWPELKIKWDIKYKHMDNVSRMCMPWAPNLNYSALRNMQNEKLQQQLMDKLLNIKFGAL